MISSVEWVPRGVADPHPKAYELSAAEKELLEKQADMEAALDEEDSDSDGEEVQAETTIKLPDIDPKTLPPELRMDEYSSDEEDNEVMQGSAVGKLLVGNNADVEEEDAMAEEEQVNQEEEGGWEDDDSDVDSDDDLEDVPDTREYAPTNLEGLQAMGLSHVGAGAAMNLDEDEDDDDDSDVDDVNIAPDDAIVVVAKTEEVSTAVSCV